MLKLENMCIKKPTNIIANHLMQYKKNMKYPQKLLLSYALVIHSIWE